jgi:hypothetical protein
VLAERVLYNPPDLEEANESYGMTCGPAALAAVMHRPAMDVRRWLATYSGYMTPTMMEAALTISLADWSPCQFRGRVADWPTYGLCWIQFAGPWELPGVPAAAAYKHTHWIGYAHVNGAMVFDVNDGVWKTRLVWELTTLKELLAHHKRSTDWYVRRAYEVRLA